MTNTPGANPDGERSRWRREHVAGIERTVDTVASPTSPPADDSTSADPASDVYVWDTWLLRGRNGEIATIDGWQVAFSLTATRELLPGERHDVAEIRCFYSADGRTWHDGGPVFGD